jgi:malyl-CoA/(S)-citramalyl-CoA lyase
MASTTLPAPGLSGTTRPFRLLRSMLFVPATSEHFFAKAARGEADGIILDLEDAVAPDQKEQARDAAVAALNDLDWGGKTLAVRVNGLETPHTYRDVIALAERCPRLDLVMLPKVNGPEEVAFVATLLEQAERSIGRATPIGIEAIIETPLGLERVGAIAQAAPRLEAISLGAGDYAVTMGMRSRVIGGADPLYAVPAADESGGGPRRHLGDKWHYPLARIANACRAYGLRPRDTAYADFKDTEGFRAACQRGVALGYDGKSAIHPSQVAIANEVFGPTAEEIAWARSLVSAMEESQRAGRGAVAVKGEMVDLANLRQAETILAKAERIAALAQAPRRPT